MRELQISEPLYLQVKRKIKESIFKGEIEPGEKIIVSKLAEEFQISRTPLREALRQLVSEDLLIQDNSSLYVVNLNSQDFKELYECRLILEKENMELIVDVISEEELNDILIILKKSDEYLSKKDYFQVMDLNTEFHDKILEASPNKKLAMLLQQIRSLLMIYRVNILKNSSYNHEINDEHYAIFEALKNRDKKQLIKMVEMHIKNDLQRGINIIKSNDF